MPTCFKTDVGPKSPMSLDVVTTYNTDGSVAYTVPRTDYANCEWVVLHGGDYGTWQPLVSMTIEDAQVIGLQIGLVWAIAFGFRLIRKALFDDRAEE